MVVGGSAPFLDEQYSHVIAEESQLPQEHVLSDGKILAIAALGEKFSRILPVIQSIRGVPDTVDEGIDDEKLVSHGRALNLPQRFLPRLRNRETLFQRLAEKLNFLRLGFPRLKCL